MAKERAPLELPKDVDYDLLGVASVLAQLGLDIALTQAAWKQVEIDEILVDISVKQASLDRFLAQMQNLQVAIDMLASVSALGAYEPPTDTNGVQAAVKTTG